MHVQWCCIEFIYLRELLSILIKYATRVRNVGSKCWSLFGVTYFIYMSYDNTRVYCVFAAAFSNAYDFVNLKFFQAFFFGMADLFQTTKRLQIMFDVWNVKYVWYLLN